MRLSAALVCAFAAVALCADPYTVNTDWKNIVALSNTTTTLQVVSNPLLNPATSPVAHAFAESLANLGADLVRFVPWFPYPRVGVAELEPPNYQDKTTSWSFKDIIPQLDLVMNATYGQGHTVIPNFSTQPTWMYNTNDWSYPKDPNAVDFSYPRGTAYSNTTQNVAEYYGRLLSWLVKGEFQDEFNNTISGGPKYNLTHWEVYNEPQGCHGITPETYNEQYDAVTAAIRKMADPEHNIKFVGLAAAGMPMDYISVFLNKSMHAPGTPLDYMSFHFYAGCQNRTDPSSYEEFFTRADGAISSYKQIAALRASMAPEVKLSCDETGVILPNDNSPTAPIPPRIYWNAAGAMYAYLAAEATKIGIEIMGESQLAGSPPIPEWDIPNPQYPSVSMINWTTGAGNARYWVLKLLIDEVGPGDELVKTTVASPSPPGQPYFCGKVDGHVGYSDMTLSCDDPAATIQSIDFAAFGTPTGTCGSYKRGTCDAGNVTSTVKSLCLGKNTCTVQSYPEFGDPCYQTYKSLVIQATCTGKAGGSATPSDPSQPRPVYAQGYITKDGHHKVLLVNPRFATMQATVPGATKGKMSTVDEATGDGPARVEALQSDTITLAPFAVAMVTMP